MVTNTTMITITRIRTERAVRSSRERAEGSIRLSAQPFGTCRREFFAEERRLEAVAAAGEKMPALRSLLAELGLEVAQLRHEMGDLLFEALDPDRHRLRRN